MAREFKPVRFFVMMALAAFVVCGVTAFYTHRAAHGRTAEERAAYAIGLKAGEQAPPGATLPTDADLNLMAQKYLKLACCPHSLPAARAALPSMSLIPSASFKQQGPGNQQNWGRAFENGYTDGVNKTHRRQ
jgi:hypothetical protein